MIGIFRSLSVVYFKRSWASLLSAIAMLVLFPYGLWTFLSWNSVEPGPDAMNFDELQFAFWGVSFIALAAASLVGEEHIRVWLSALPISNKAVVGWLLISTAVTMFASLIVVDLLYDVVFGGSWPILWPAFFFAVSTCVLQAIYWQFLVGRLRWLPYSVLIGVAMVAWFVFRVGRNTVSSDRFNWMYSTADYFGLVMVAILSSFCGMHAFRRLRSAELPETFSLRDIPQAFDDLGRRIARLRNFDWRTRDAGLVWYQRRESGVFILMAVLIGGLAPLPVFASICFSMTELPLFEQLFPVFVMPLAISMMLGSCIATIWAKPFQSNGEHDMTAFFATKPISNKEFARNIHGNLFRASLIVAVSVTVIWIVCYFICRSLQPTAALFASGQLWRESTLGYWGFLVVFGIVLAECYTSCCLCANVVLTGRKHLIAPTVLAFCFLFVSVVAVFKFDLFGRLSYESKSGIVLVFLTMLAVFVATSFAIAKKQDLISGWTLVYAVLFAIASAIAIPLTATTPMMGLCAGIFACLSISGPSCCSLAIDWNRHR